MSDDQTIAGRCTVATTDGGARKRRRPWQPGEPCWQPVNTREGTAYVRGEVVLISDGVAEVRLPCVTAWGPARELRRRVPEGARVVGTQETQK